MNYISSLAIAILCFSFSEIFWTELNKDKNIATSSFTGDKCYNIYLDIRPDSIKKLIDIALVGKKHQFKYLDQMDRFVNLEMTLDTALNIQSIKVQSGKKNKEIRIEIEKIIQSLKYIRYENKYNKKNTICNSYWASFSCVFDENGEIMEVAYADCPGYDKEFLIPAGAEVIGYDSVNKELIFKSNKDH